MYFSIESQSEEINFADFFCVFDFAANFPLFNIGKSMATLYTTTIHH